MAKYVFVTERHLLSLQGITAASVGRLLRLSLHVSFSSSTPTSTSTRGRCRLSHGEVFVTVTAPNRPRPRYYERVIDENLTRLRTSRPAGSTGGHRQGAPRRLPRWTVQSSPYHKRDQGADLGGSLATAIRRRHRRGRGTVGDIEPAVPRAIRQMRKDVGRANVLYIPSRCCRPSPRPASSRQATQHSVKELRGIGIQPTHVLLRDHPSATRSARNAPSRRGDRRGHPGRDPDTTTMPLMFEAAVSVGSSSASWASAIQTRAEPRLVRALVKRIKAPKPSLESPSSASTSNCRMPTCR